MYDLNLHTIFLQDAETTARIWFGKIFFIKPRRLTKLFSFPLVGIMEKFEFEQGIDTVTVFAFQNG